MLPGTTSKLFVSYRSVFQGGVSRVLKYRLPKKIGGVPLD